MKRLILVLLGIGFIAAQAIFFTTTLEKAENFYKKTIDNQEKIIYNKGVEIEELKKRIEILQEKLEEQGQEQEQKQRAGTIPITVTHYSSEETGSDMTASGNRAIEGYSVACNFLPLGTHVIIDGREYVVHDRGGMPYGVVDIYVSSSAEAIRLGTYSTEMEVLQ